MQQKQGPAVLDQSKSMPMSLIIANLLSRRHNRRPPAVNRRATHHTLLRTRSAVRDNYSRPLGINLFPSKVAEE